MNEQGKITRGWVMPLRQLEIGHGEGFSAERIEAAARSARIVVPLVMRLLPDVRSVVEIGCGVGVWLAEFKRSGAAHVVGVDHQCVAPQHLEIDPKAYFRADLKEIAIVQAFDLCVCLEVAQCLPDDVAPLFVQNLCKLSDVILFSAAIPGQGGADYVNERWPSYWVDIFQEGGYEVLDIIRGCIWSDARVDWQYRQNMLLFANKAGLKQIAWRSKGESVPSEYQSAPLDIVHPECFHFYRGIVASTEARSMGIAALARGAKDPRPRYARYLRPIYWRNKRVKIFRSIKKRLSHRL